MIVHMQCFVHVLSSDLTVVWFGEKGLCKLVSMCHWLLGQ